MEDPSDDSQPQGFYPRVNGKSLATGQYANMIVSLVGHFLPTPNADGTVPFKASDGGIISVTPEQVEMPLIGPDSSPFEIIGQAMGPADLFVRIVVVGHCCVSSAQYGALVPQMVSSQPHTIFLALIFFLLRIAVLHERAHEGYGLGNLRQNAGGASQPQVRSLLFACGRGGPGLMRTGSTREGRDNTTALLAYSGSLEHGLCNFQLSIP
jgi:hypothetical protein